MGELADRRVRGGRDRGSHLNASVRKARLAGWGRYPVVDCVIQEPATPPEVTETLAALPSSIARGNGRSYGDASLNAEGVALMRRMGHMLAFNEATGELLCEAGVMLSDIIEVFLPRGWFPPVTPGTRFVTVGGMIAADVHGKNHHVSGSFGDHILWLDLALPDGRVLRCSAKDEPELFAATCGGMGLTGVVLRAAFRLQRVETAYIRQHRKRVRTLEHAFEAFEETQRATYSVGWIDALASGRELGRSVIFTGEHARVMDLPRDRQAYPFECRTPGDRRVPIDFPAFALSRASVRLFNAFYYSAQRPGETIIDLYRCFYPLDALLDWNRIYGRRGFVQYQCVLPLTASLTGMRRLLGEIASAGEASFLAVLKRMGRQSFGMLSFPMEGYTLALDFPANAANMVLLDRLDQIVLDHGGRIYLAKDARAGPNTISAGYPQLERFRQVRRDFRLAGRIESAQSQRLEI